MTKPTYTLQQLRRSIEREMGMDFSRRFPSGASVTGTSSDAPDEIVDSKLTQTDNFWVNSWAYIVSDTSSDNVGQSRLIVGNVSADDKLYLEYDLPAALSSDATYEILNWFSANEVHGAINDAIREGGSKAFFETIIDETLVHEEDQLTYDISALTEKPWIVTKAYLEITSTRRTGKATSAAAGTLLDTTANFSDVTSSWKVSIYSGTGSGQLRSISSVTGTTQLNITPNWTTTPDTTSKYAIWNPTQEENEWFRLTTLKFDQKEFPSLMRLPVEISDCLGLRFRLEYISQPDELTADSDTTIVPMDYIRPKAVSRLYGQMISNNKADRQRWAAEQQRYAQEAEQYIQQNAFQMPDRTMWQQANGMTYINPIDPLGWND